MFSISNVQALDKSKILWLYGLNTIIEYISDDEYKGTPTYDNSFIQNAKIIAIVIKIQIVKMENRVPKIGL